MKRLLWVIVTALVLVAVVAGCGGEGRYDARLVRADSLMHDWPDSALALVQAVAPDGLTREGDRAYRDLLLTQGRYRCYVTATSDSDINRALAYYLAHDGEREKLTRAYLYKGAVMEELGHPDSAMLYYKHAEATAAPDDYFNLGQANTRIGKLYRLYYGDKQTCADKYKQALHYYQIIGYKPLQLDCMMQIGGCSGITHAENPEKWLEQASKLALELNDSATYLASQELLCRQLYSKTNSRPRAKQIALRCLREFPSLVNNNLILDLADIYAYSGMTDSANYFLSQLNESAIATNLGQMRVRKLMIQSRLSMAEGNTTLSNYYDKLAHIISDSILNNKQKYQIQQIENSFNSSQRTNAILHVSASNRATIFIFLIMIIVCSVLVTAFIRQRHTTKAIIKEFETFQPTNLDYLYSTLDKKSGALERLFCNLLELIKMCVSEAKNGLSVPEVTKLIKHTIVDTANDDFWTELRLYLDKRYNGIITKIAQNKNLKEKDLRFIELSCCGFSHVEIAIIMNYSPKYVFNKRKIIAQKLDIDTTLQEYLDSMKLENE